MKILGLICKDLTRFIFEFFSIFRSAFRVYLGMDISEKDCSSGIHQKSMVVLKKEALEF